MRWVENQGLRSQTRPGIVGKRNKETTSAAKYGIGEQNMTEGEERWGTLRAAAGISLVLGVRLSGELIRENEVERRRERRGVGGCMKNADGDGFNVEARVWT